MLASLCWQRGEHTLVNVSCQPFHLPQEALTFAGELYGVGSTISVGPAATDQVSEKEASNNCPQRRPINARALRQCLLTGSFVFVDGNKNRELPRRCPSDTG
jgi:hypothetical protein